MGSGDCEGCSKGASYGVGGIGGIPNEKGGLAKPGGASISGSVSGKEGTSSGSPPEPMSLRQSLGSSTVSERTA